MFMDFLGSSEFPKLIMPAGVTNTTKYQVQTTLMWYAGFCCAVVDLLGRGIWNLARNVGRTAIGKYSKWPLPPRRQQRAEAILSCGRNACLNTKYDMQ